MYDAAIKRTTNCFSAAIPVRHEVRRWNSCRASRAARALDYARCAFLGERDRRARARARTRGERWERVPFVSTSTLWCSRAKLWSARARRRLNSLARHFSRTGVERCSDARLWVHERRNDDEDDPTAVAASLSLPKFIIRGFSLTDKHPANILRRSPGAKHQQYLRDDSCTTRALFWYFASGNKRMHALAITRTSDELAKVPYCVCGNCASGELVSLTVPFHRMHNLVSQHVLPWS